MHQSDLATHLFGAATDAADHVTFVALLTRWRERDDGNDVYASCWRAIAGAATAAEG